MTKKGRSDKGRGATPASTPSSAADGQGRRRPSKLLSDLDLALWRRVVESATPVAKNTPKTDQPAASTPRPPENMPPPAPKPAAPRQSVRLEGASRPPVSTPQLRPSVQNLSPSTPGLDRRTAQRLRRGKIAPEGRLDLHGMTMARAHQALIGFIQSRYAAGARCVLVITGKGGRQREPQPGVWREPEPGSGVLKSQTPLWLSQPPLNIFVTGVYPAHISHGGGGALYVYLRKNPGARDRE